ncbi:hypothetical protein FHL15_010832 [Xylaria flabelliformis]|uniref:Nephrocystin 3-like N-terminal domain-containing protein n=1 Tax=Xylaria flabelliformis TaxID=2512241 RepID=A0A553HJY8_9PEZI|nr:hypothetical protein FHL15_010832 [Xylaria flabelliformis]
MDLRSRVSEVREESKSRGDDLDQLSRRQVDMINTLTRIDDATRNLNQTLIMFYLQQREIVETIWSSSWSLEQPIQVSDGDDVKFPMDDSNINNDAACSKAILPSLFLEDLRYREGAIPEAYESTFKWLFESPRSDVHGQPLWSDFQTWLRSSNSDVYWITGKPGSGKSTVMKFVIGHSMLQELLAQWSGPKPFLLARFYFWNAGTPIQRTQEGLLRTLLYQCLRQRPLLIQKVCPRRWVLFKVFGSEVKTAAPPWTLDELLESFSAFDLFVGQQFNLALFIDGLDEFDGDHRNLIEFVRLFHSRTGRKVCVSSRPWNVFQDAFMASPSLRLENLTGDDIRLYVQCNLNPSPAFQEYKDALPEQSKGLVETIITKAQGVFLWVSVVVLHIREGLSEGDRWEELYDMVNLLPDDLSQLYQRIWSTIKLDYIGQSHLFQIHGAYIDSLDVITLWLADHPDTLQIDVKTIPEQQDLITQTMRRRLSSRTRGPLEISPQGYVGYLHRSVRDWIEHIWGDIVAKSDPAFDPSLCILNAQTVWMLGGICKADKCISQVLTTEYDWKEVLKCLYDAANVRHIASNIHILVATLDRLNDKIQTFSHTSENEAIIPLSCNKVTSRHGVTLPANSFVGLAAQFGILKYVRHKLMVDPQLLRGRHRPPEVSILANAILSPRYFAHYYYARNSDVRITKLPPNLYRYYHLHNNSYVRYLLIKLLLDCGVAKSSAVVPGDTIKSLYDEASWVQVQMPPIIMPNVEELDYWQTVAKLLKEHGLSRVGYFELKVKPLLLKLFH